MTWALIAWCALIAVWCVAGANANHCSTSQYVQACRAGTGLGVLLILFLGAIGFIVLALVWMMSRPRDRN